MRAAMPVPSNLRARRRIILISVRRREPLFTSCNRCHLILAQGDNVDLAEAVDFMKGKDFYHPGYDGFIGEFSLCIECHTGGADLS